MGRKLNHHGVGRKRKVYSTTFRADLPRHLVKGKIVVGKKLKPVLQGGD